MMSEFRFEKLRVPAELTLLSGPPVAGTFFVAGSASEHDGPERVGDLLNAEPGFFPFQRADGTTTLYNRAHVLIATLGTQAHEAESEPGYDLAKKLSVTLRLANGRILSGSVPVYRPRGRDRLSDYAQAGATFRYLLTDSGELLVNAAHIVELRESEG
jgi:hypothetical protein